MQLSVPVKKIIASVLIITWVFSDWTHVYIPLGDASLLIGPRVATALAAESLVDTTVNTTDFGSPGAKQVWTSPTTGYIFYANSTGNIVMASTTNGGTTWSSERQVDSQNTTDAVDVAVWWDGWTEDSGGRYIHISVLDSGVNDLYYTQLDLETGIFSTPALGTNQSAVIIMGTGYASITKTSDGVLYMSGYDNNDSWTVRCTTTCTNTVDWTEIAGGYGSTPDGVGNAPQLLSPAGAAIPANNLLLVYVDTVNSTLDYNIYSATSSSWWFTTAPNVATSIDINSTFEGQMASLAYDPINAASYMALVEDANDYTTADHDIKVWKYTLDGGWVAKTNPITDSASGLTAAKIGINQDNGYLYIVYTRRTTIGTPTTANIYYKVSYDDGATWSAESAALNTTTDSLFFVDATTMSRFRFGASWKYITAANDDDLYFAPINIWYDVKRTARLFEGHTIKIRPGSRMIIHQELE